MNGVWIFLITFLSLLTTRNETDNVNGERPGDSLRIAFPGAEGFGKYASGGRGGIVYLVTNLNDNGPGSLREAVNAVGPRTILFALSGNITLQSPLRIAHDNITIAGHSAPGDGICIRNFPVTIDANNVVIRFMRFRLGDVSGVEGDALEGNHGNTNIIIDHCSISWATDECASFYGNKNFTLQWCIISESLNRSIHQKGAHGYGGIWGGEGATFHHNLIVSHSSRLPRFSGSPTTPNPPGERVDFRNNVVCNWASNSVYGGERGRYNIVNNYFKPGPATPSSKHWFVNPYSPFGSFYIDGNVFEDDTRLTRQNWDGVRINTPDSARALQPFVVTPINQQDGSSVLTAVLSFAGASLCRDAVDSRIVEEVRTGKFSFGKKNDGIIDSQNEVGGWPVLQTLPLPTDANNNHVSDRWEEAHGFDLLSKTQAANADSILEAYLNSKVEKCMP